MPRDTERIDIAAEFDRRAERYDRNASHRWQAERAAAVTAPQPAWSVLDVATGTGLAARALAAHIGNTGKIVGVDISSGMLKVARRTSPPICHYVCADAARLPFADQWADALVCVAGIPYFEDLAAAFAEWRRVCRAGGSVVFTVPADDGITEFRLLQQAASAQGIHLANVNAGLGDAQRLTDFAKTAGMVCQQVIADSFTEPLISNPDALWHRFLSHGFAEPLRTTAKNVRGLVLDGYRQAFRRERAAGNPAEHTVLFVHYTSTA